MNEELAAYIAGFFDGEGSAMVLTHRVKEKLGYHYRIRPVIKIVQKTKPILEFIRDSLGFGTVTTNYSSSGACWVYQLNGQERLLKFISLIRPYCRLKKRQLDLITKMIFIQTKMNQPYGRKELENIISIRDEIFSINNETKSGIKQFHPKEKILREHIFIDLDNWKSLKRLKKNA